MKKLDVDRISPERRAELKEILEECGPEAVMGEVIARMHKREAEKAGTDNSTPDIRNNFFLNDLAESIEQDDARKKLRLVKDD